jgi:hypothetical protein
MKTTQGWGWLAAGVLALGLNGIYQDGGAAWAHRIANRVVQQTESMGMLASLRGDRLLKQTKLVVARDETASCRLSTAMARFQTQIARTQIARTQNGMAYFEAMSARQEAALARMEANRARIEAQVAGVRLTPVAFESITIPEVACVRVRVPRVIVPRVHVNIPAPVVVEMGSGPI